MASMKKIFWGSIVFLLTSCGSLKESDFKAVWKFSGISDQNIDDKDGKSIDTTFSYFLKQTSEEFLANSFINFYNEKSFVFRLGNSFKKGKWNYNREKETLQLISDQDSLYISVEEFDGKGRMSCSIDNKYVFKQTYRDSIDQAIDDGMVKYFPKAKCLCDFEKDTFTYSKSSDNIFSLENNSWRIKPIKKETSKQIRQRLRSNIHYIAAFLKNSITRNDETINLSALYSPIKMGGNGIAIFSSEEIPQEWIDIFYDKQQALEAYNMLVLAFLQKITINNQESWLELDADLLNQIYSKL